MVLVAAVVAAVIRLGSKHMRQHLERGITSDEALDERARAFLSAGSQPRVRHLL